MDEVITQEEIDILLGMMEQNDNECCGEVEICDRKKIRTYNLKYETSDEYVRISYDDSRTVSILFSDSGRKIEKYFCQKRNEKISLYPCFVEKVSLKSFVDSFEDIPENFVSIFLFETNLGKFFIEIEDKFCFFLLNISERANSSLTKDEFEKLYENYIKFFVKTVLKSVKAKIKENSTREINIEIKKVVYKSGLQDLKQLKTNIICSTFGVVFSEDNEGTLNFCFLQDFEYSLRKNFFFDKIQFSEVDSNDSSNSSKEKNPPNIFIQTDFYDVSENTNFENGSIINLPDADGFGVAFNVVFEDKIIAFGEIVTIDDSIFGIRIAEKYKEPIKIEDKNRFCVRFSSLFIPPEEISDKIKIMSVIEFEKSLLDTQVEIISNKTKIATAEFCPELEKIAVKVVGM